MALRACRNKTWKAHVFRTFCELTGAFLYNNFRMVFLKGILLVQGKPVTQPVHFFQCHLAELIRVLIMITSDQSKLEEIKELTEYAKV